MYILIDRARSGTSALFEIEDSGRSLYKGSAEDSLEEFAPYLFNLPLESEFGKLVSASGWGNSWGIFVQSEGLFEEIYKHFRKFLKVKTESGKQLYFRFYDPRVLRIFLPTCSSAQLIEFFGPVKQFIVEDSDPQFALRFWLENGALKQDKMNAQSFFAGKTDSENTIQHTAQNSKQNKPQAKNPWLD